MPIEESDQRRSIGASGVIPALTENVRERKRRTGTDSRSVQSERIEELRRVIDESHRRTLDAARQEWETRFGGPDASDVCVHVHVAGSKVSVESHGNAGAGFLPIRAKPTNGRVRRRLA
jgi:hypothetical protein